MKLSIPKRYSGRKLYKEIWRPIKGFENYMVSNLGRVKSLYHGKEKILKPINNSGYLMVNLYKNGKRKKYLIHRLVAIAFIPNTDNKTEVDHINTIRTDNRVENLRWVTSKENSNNELSKKNYSKSNKGRKYSEETKDKKRKKIYCIELDKVFNSIKEASEELNISKGSICLVCKGIYKQIKGYHFIYYEDYLNIA